MEIAKSIIPNIFCNTAIPASPRSFSILPVSRRTAKTKIILIIIAINIFIWLYTALKEIIEVIVPAPAIKGNAIGTIDADLEVASESLNKLIPSIISTAKINMTNEPATANSATPIPKIPIIFSPKNKKATIMYKDTRDALKESMPPAFFFMLTITGTEPTMSMTAKSTIVAFNISLMSKFIVLFFNGLYCCCRERLHTFI